MCILVCIKVIWDSPPSIINYDTGQYVGNTVFRYSAIGSTVWGRKANDMSPIVVSDFLPECTVWTSVQGEGTQAERAWCADLRRQRRG